MLSKDNSEESKKRAIDQLFNSKALVDVLWALIRHADRLNVGLAQSDLVKLTGHPLQAVQRALERLSSPPLELVFFFENIRPPENFDLVTLVQYKSKEQARKESKKRGRGRYLLPRDHPWFPALKLLLENAVGVLDVLRVDLNQLPDIDVAFVYGSFATAEHTSESDVDLIVIGQHTLKSLAKPMAEVQRRINRDVDYQIYRPDDWHQKASEAGSFTNSLLYKPKIFLIGDNERLERITAERVG